MLPVLPDVIAPSFASKYVQSSISYRGAVLWNAIGESVYNICLITISDTVSDGAKKRLILNIERAQHD